MKRSTRRYILVILFLLGLALKKNGIGLSVFLTFPVAIMIAVEMLRSAYTHEKSQRLQLAIYIPFSIFLLIAVAQLQYWIYPYKSGMPVWILWLTLSILFLLKSKSGWMQNVIWVIVSILLTSAAFMNPRQYHNFYKYSRYEDYIRRRYTETERDIADMYIDRYKKIDKEKSSIYFKKALEAENSENNDAALVYYNAAVDHDPDNSELIFRRGYFKLSTFELNRDLAYNAIKDFDRAIRLDSNFTDAYINRSVALGYVGQKERAYMDELVVERLRPPHEQLNAIRKNLKHKKK